MKYSEVEVFTEAIKNEFGRLLKRINYYRRGLRREEIHLHIKTSVKEGSLWIIFASAKRAEALQIPLPWEEENGIKKVGSRVQRAVGVWITLKDKRVMSYLEFMYQFLTNSEFMPLMNTGLPEMILLEQIINSFDGNDGRLVTNIQRLINMTVNSLPLYERGKDMLAWAVNERIMVIDPLFSSLNPDGKLKYQIAKNEACFDQGWTSIGLSDSTLAEQNYLLKTDLRTHLCPFGTRHHNPQRNLYQTLGIKGDELPAVRTEFENDLINKGITRTGWNLMTVFLDIPLNFEDQIVVRRELAEKIVTTHYRTYICWGVPTVGKNEEIKKGDVISVEPSEEPIVFRIDCDKATVESVKDELVPLNNKPHPVKVITVKIERKMRDGTKITNLHGNKGVIRVSDTGIVWDPVREQEIPIDVVVSSASVRRRKNFGQLLEALFTLVRGKDEPIVIPNDVAIGNEGLKKMIKGRGYPKPELTAKTKWGTFECVAGWVFWGVSKDAEDQIWTKRDVERVNGKEQRVAGVKISHIEMKSLFTTFGPGSAVVKEIMSHQQGIEEVHEKLRIIASMEGKLPKDMVELDWKDVPFVEVNGKTFFEPEEIAGTIADEAFMPDGFIMKLPFTMQTTLFRNPLERPYEGAINEEVSMMGDRTVCIDKIYIPKGFLRRQWLHLTGCVGLNDISTRLNNLLVNLRREDSSGNFLSYWSLSAYFHFISQRLSTKRGGLNQLALAARYPNSTKGVATCSDDLPENWIEIHRDMAKDLGVRNGDCVLVERFPCLGFMSIRVQKVRITDDEHCRYTVRTSINPCFNLGSLSLDFDGDVIYPFAFETEEAKAELEREFNDPHPYRKKIIDDKQVSKVPVTAALSLADYNIERFPDMTVEDQKRIVDKAVGVKAHTGPVIALAYNLMRIVESDIPYNDIETHASIENLLDFLGNTVFSQKHGVESLHHKAIDAICLCDLDAMVEMGFERKPSELIVSLIRKKAAEFCRIRTQKELEEKHRLHKEEGKSNIISTIVRRQNKLYFATRASLHPIRLLEHLRTQPNDLVSFMFKHAMKRSTSPQIWE